MHSLLRLLRFVLNLQGAAVLGACTRPSDDSVVIQVRRRSNAKPRCPVCRRTLKGRVKNKKREWRHLDLIRRRTVIAAEIREGYCAKHGRRVERVPWAAPGSRHTQAFDEAIASLVQVADKTAAGRMFRVAWRTVGRIVERVVARKLSKNRLDGLEFIGVDETSYKRGHRYMTVVMDLMTGRVVWVGEGKSAETLGEFFKELGPRRSERLRMVAMDMSAAFKSAIDQHVPHVDIVYDRYHVVKLLLDAVDEIRREEVRKLQGNERSALKSTRFALLRNPKRHLSDKDVAAVERVRRTNRALARTYELRCDFEELWEITDPDKAREFAMNWTRAALRSRKEPLRKFARTVRKHLDGILGYFKYWGTSSGVVEGTNNKIKLAVHRAYGFHSLDALMSMVYLCCSGLVVSW